MVLPSPTLTISCAGDAELAAAIQEFLASECGARASLEDDEISVAVEPEGGRKDILAALSKYASERLEGYSLIEFGDDVVIVGMKAEPEELGLHVCGQCGFQTASADAMTEHSKLHGGYLFMPPFL